MEKAISGMLSALDPHSGYMNEETFKEISKAYEVLVDKEKRNIYDRMGEEGLSNNVSVRAFISLEPIEESVAQFGISPHFIIFACRPISSIITSDDCEGEMF